MMLRRARPLIASWLLLLGCGRFPEIDKNVCGNAVIEAGEDCDIFAPFTGAICRQPGSEGACHLDCRVQSDGKRAPCFSGWGCDDEGICRAPSGAFVKSGTFIKGNVDSLMSGDFDGDEHAELVSRSQPDDVGRAYLEILHFDEQARLNDTRAFPPLSFEPAVRDLDGDGKEDLIFNDSRVGVVRGRDDGALVPDICGTYVLPGAAHIVIVSDGPVQGGDAIAAVADAAGEVGLYAPDIPTGELLKLSVLPGRFADVLLENESDVDLIEDDQGAPCRELVYALRGASSFNVINLCQRVAGAMVWRAGADLVSTEITLEPPQPITQAPLSADVNGDGHADVLIGTADGVYLALGDGQTLGPARPFRVKTKTRDFSATMPLAVHDLTDDGTPDFVYPSYIIATLPNQPPESPQYEALYVSTSGKPWTSARIGHVYADAQLDVVAASNELLGIDVFTKPAQPDHGFLHLPTNGPVLQLALGDFDDDSFGDIAYVERSPAGDGNANLQIAFQAPGVPLSPQLISVLPPPGEFLPFVDGDVHGLGLGSTQRRDGSAHAVLTLLGGTHSRLPVAPCELNEFDATLSLVGWPALSVALGAFSGAGHGDIMALARSPSGDFDAASYRFWLLPDFAVSTSSPRMLDGELDTRLRPAHGSEVDSEIQLAALAADFSGAQGSNGEQALFAMPTEDGQCGLLRVGFAPPKSARFIDDGPLILPEPCEHPQVMAVDADEDGFVDLVLLTGTSDGARTLSLLWNEQGHFSAEHSTRLSAEREGPRAFTLLPRTAAQPLGIAYVTDEGLMLLRATDEPRAFSPTQPVADISGATGVTAGDLDGDRVVDLAVAAGGNLHVFKAELTAR